VNKLSTTEPDGHGPPDCTAAAVADAPAAGDGRIEERGELSDRTAGESVDVDVDVGVASPVSADAIASDDVPWGAGMPDLAGLAGLAWLAGLAMPGRPGTAVPSAVAGSKLESLDGDLVPPPPEAPQARMPSRPRPRARVITRRRQ
jgi:hypothetical protein